MSQVLITGGAGFIGANLAARLLAQGHSVRVLDNGSRPGAAHNRRWLEESWTAPRLRFFQADVNDAAALSEAAEGAERIYHLAGQVAVTTSVRDPRADFEANALGTFNVLEAARLRADRPAFLYASSNKVYGALAHTAVEPHGGRYVLPAFPHGVDEGFPLDFHSPYGCSKGAGDQYTRDYARIYGLRSVVLRQSCVYGPRQFGMADQGWLAWFLFAALEGRPVRICGDGRQVRDVLWIGDLLDAYEAVMSRADDLAGQVFNVGGGPENAIAVWADFGPLAESLLGRSIPVEWHGWRPGDQRVFVADTRKLQAATGWRPATGWREGIERLHRWIAENGSLLRAL